MGDGWVSVLGVELLFLAAGAFSLLIGGLTVSKLHSGSVRVVMVSWQSFFLSFSELIAKDENTGVRRTFG